MEFLSYCKKHSFTVGTEFTADMAPCHISYPEYVTPHRRQ